MATLERHESEWQCSQAKILQAEQKVSSLKTTLNAFVQTDEIQALIRAKEQVREEMNRLMHLINKLNLEVEGCRYWIQLRKKALVNHEARKGLNEQTIERTTRLERLERNNAPSVIVGNEKRMVWECTAPIEEIEQKIAEQQQKKQEAELARQNAKETIREIDDKRRAKKRLLEQEIQENEQIARQNRKKLAEWTKQDEEHQNWTLQHHPDFCTAHGIVASAKTQTVQIAQATPSPPKRERARIETQITVESPQPKTQPWKFFITFDEKARGILLPNQEGEFVKEVCPMLQGARLYKLNGKLLYQKLIEATRKSVHQRQRMSQINGNRMFHSWKKIKIGAYYRVLLKFDEQSHVLVFSPQTHEIYQKIWRG